MSEQQVTEAVLITEDQARKTEPVVREPDALALKEQQNNHDKAMAGLHRGWIGWLVGSGPEKSGNVATLTIFACFLIILIAFMKFDFNTQFESFFKIMTSVFGPVGLALGYLFGAKDSKH